MKHFTSVADVPDVPTLIAAAAAAKANPYQDENLGRHKTLGLFFFNASLRTRLSTQKAAENLGMKVMVVNLNQEGWALEFQDGVLMDGNKPEHIREAAAVIGQYCDIIGVRSFPELKSREADYAETVLNGFRQWSGKPILSLESATRHPLQSLADALTIEELWRQHPDYGKRQPKVVLTWAPHPRALPQCVPNSFAEWMGHPSAGLDLTIVQPEGYDLADEFVSGARISYDQEAALEGADFVYAKNWSSYHQYGQALKLDRDWMITEAKLDLTNGGKLMHCLPTRRNVELADEVLDSSASVVIQQAGNRVPAAQAVIKQLLMAI